MLETPHKIKNIIFEFPISVLINLGIIQVTNGGASDIPKKLGL
jgi:hypothetical protein